MREAEIYVVRVYRRDAGRVVGVVEHVGEQMETAFHTVEDLVDLILGRTAPTATQHETDEGGL